MDPIAHTLVGASLAQNGLRRTTPYAAAALIAGANLPDIDTLATFGGSDVALWFRRGWSHGVPALVVLPILLTLLLVFLSRRRAPKVPVRPGVLLALTCFAVLFWENSAFEVNPSRHNDRYQTLVRYIDRDVLQSGWLIGEEHLANKAAMVSAKLGDGTVVLIGFRTQHRAQTHGTFKLLFNALLQ